MMGNPLIGAGGAPLSLEEHAEEPQRGAVAQAMYALSISLLSTFKNITI